VTSPYVGRLRLAEEIASSTKSRTSPPKRWGSAEEVSRLMDRRLYRLKLLYWSLPAGRPDRTRSPLAEPRMEDYRQVLYEWNDSVNRNLALVQQYFGDEMRRRLDNVIGAAFVELGRSVEQLWAAEADTPATVVPKLDRRLTELSSLIYGFNLHMIRATQAGAVGWLVIENRRRPAPHSAQSLPK
jgi:hypothetical protein